jgi:cytochrome c oxidase subunit IV
MAQAAGTHGEQQHPLGLYLKIWGLLFVLSTMSYLVDYYHVPDTLKHFLVTSFALLKAGLIVGVFMHMAYERLALIYAILMPPLLLMALVGIMVVEGEYTLFQRGTFYTKDVVIEKQEHKAKE